MTLSNWFRLISSKSTSLFSISMYFCPATVRCHCSGAATPASYLLATACRQAAVEGSINYKLQKKRLTVNYRWSWINKSYTFSSMLVYIWAATHQQRSLAFGYFAWKWTNLQRQLSKTQASITITTFTMWYSDRTTLWILRRGNEGEFVPRLYDEFIAQIRSAMSIGISSIWVW